MIRIIRTWLARRRLQRIVEANRLSFATQDYARRRRAALRHTPRIFLPACVNPLHSPSGKQGRGA